MSVTPINHLDIEADSTTNDVAESHRTAGRRAGHR